ncbi:MCE family protein [Thermomonospora catenispora]|nr:MCE family protein [Thermomonospora catenispora]
MALKSFRDRNRITVGVVSSGILVLLVVSVYLIGTEGLLRDRYTMSGVFADSGGLRPGDEVRVAGVEVGEVTEVKPDWANGRVLVAWEVDSEVKLGTATRAEVRVSNVLGGRHLRLSGPVAAPYMDDLPERRRRIPLERTAVPTTFNDVLKSSTEAVRRLDTRSIQTIVDELGGLSERDRGRLSRALTDLTEVAETVDESDPQIRTLLDNGERLVALADSKERQLLTLMDNVQAMLKELELRRDELSAFLGGGDATVKSMTRLIDRQQAKLASIVKDLQTTLAALRPANDDLNALLAWAGPTLSGLSSVGGRGPWLEVVATGLGPLSPEDLAALARLARRQGAAR